MKEIFSRRALIITLIVLGFSVLVGSSAYLLMPKNFSADSVPISPSIDMATLASATDNQRLDTPTIVLNYEKAAIEGAILRHRESSLAQLSGLSAIDKEITTALDAKYRSLLTASKASAVAYTLIDKNGQVVNQNPVSLSASSQVAGTASISNVADNFDFAPDISEVTKTNLITAYPKIEALYGKRSNIDRIKITQEKECVPIGRSCYMPWQNAIIFSYNQVNESYVALHELIHAFHGPFCLEPIWEEGMTTAATYIIDNTQSIPKDALTNYEEQNLPMRDFYGVTTAKGIDPYMWGSAAFYKIYLENKQFFLNFNPRLYAITYPTDSTLTKLVGDVIPKIEGEYTTEWFSHQYSFMPRYDATWNSINYFFYGEGSEGLGLVIEPISNGGGSVGWSTGVFARKPIKTINLRAVDSKNAEIVTCTKDVSATTGNYNDTGFGSEAYYFYGLSNSDCVTKKSADGFLGLVKATLWIDGDTKTSMTKYFQLFGNTYQEMPIRGMITSVADQVELVNLDTNWRTTAAVTNGLFSFGQSSASQAGRYQINAYKTVSKCITGTNICTSSRQLVAQKFLNKPEGTYSAVIDAPYCSTNITTTALNRSITMKATTADGNACGLVFRLNGVPVYRTWASSAEYSFSDLEKAKTYTVSLLASKGYNRGSGYYRQVSTLSAPDFTLISAEPYSKPDISGIGRKFTFSTPVDMASTALIKISLDAFRATKSYKTVVEKISDKSIAVYSTEKLYGGTSYIIESLYDLKDTTGNPIYDLKYEHASYTTPLLGGAADTPTYNFNPSTIISGQTLEIPVNFTAADFANHADLKFTNLRNYLNGAYFPGIDYIPATEVTRVLGIVQKCMASFQESCKAYDLDGDGKTNLSDSTLIADYSNSKESLSGLIFRYKKIQTFTYNSDDTNTEIRTTATLANGKVAVSFLDPLVKGKTYYFYIPFVVDDNYNLVQPFWIELTVGL